MLSLPHIPEAGVFRAVVVRIDLVPTLQTLEVFAVTVVFVGESTVGVRTPLARMGWLNLLNNHTLVWSLVLDVLDKTTERPHMMPLGIRQALPNVRQILDHDYIAVVGNRFADDLSGNSVDILFPPCSLPFPKSQ